MELRQLRYFVAVVEAGTVSGAARQLNMSQPPLSAQLHALEEDLGCPLFEHTGRRLRLTAAGTAFYERAKTILQLCGAARAEMADRGAGRSGVLRVGVVSSVCGTLFTNWLRAHAAACPGARYQIHEANTYQLVEQLRCRQIDLAIVRTPFAAPELDCLPLREEPMLAVGLPPFFAAADRTEEGETPFQKGGTAFAAIRDTAAYDKKSPLAAAGPWAAPSGSCSASAGSAAGERESLSLAALTETPLVLYRRWEEIVRGQFRLYGCRPQVRCVCDGADTALRLAGAGLGVALTPASAAASLPAGVEVRPLAERDLASRIAALTRRGDLPAPAESFLALLRQDQAFSTECS